MNNLNPFYWWRRFLTLSNDSYLKTLLVAFLVALCSALAVSVTAVSLRPLQQANLAAQRQAQMDEMVATLPGMADILRETGADSLETLIVDLTTAQLANDIDSASFDYRAVQSDPSQSTILAADLDGAGIGLRPHYAPVYALKSGGKIVLIILPVYGAGYQSTLHAYLALKDDFNTIAALQIYEQGETPGLGSRITDPNWQSLWPGRQIADADGVIRIEVVRGSAATVFEVDGITGATRSTTGVTKLVQFWLGADGFGPFLANLKAGNI